MITLHTWGTPNGRKITIIMEELGVPYELKPVNIGKDEQFDPEFLKISPNNKIPAITDDEGPDGPISLFESGAILIYLADKFGRFLPPESNDRYTAIQWLMWQMGGLGPMFGQLGWFVVSAPERNEMAIERYRKECERLLNVMERRLAEVEYLAGDYSIADIAVFPWLAQYRVRVKEYIDPMIAERPNVTAWFDRVAAREGVIRGMKLP
ncbi:MAG: glutathione S-transferase family protein [Asticcacaulis sp.]